MNYKLIQRLKRSIAFLLDATGVLRAGIRITDDAIQYFEARRLFGAWRVRKFVEERDFDPRNIEFSLSRLFQKKGGILPWAMTVTLESKGVIARIIDLPHVPRAKIASSIVWEIKKYLPFDPGTVVVDHQVLGAVDEEGRRHWKVLFVAAKKREVEAVPAQLARFGVRTRAVRSIPLSFVNQYRPNPNDTSIAYVSFHDGDVAISILEKNRLLFTNVTYVKGKKALYRHVLDVLKKFIEQRVSFLEKVIVSPGHEELAEQVMDQLNIMVVEETADDFAFPAPADLIAKGHGPFLYSVLRASALDIDLLPAEQKAARRRTAYVAAGAALLGVAILAGGLFYAHMRAANAEFAFLAERHAGDGSGSSRSASSGQSRVEELRQQLSQAEGFEKQIKDMEDEIRLLGQISGRSSNWNRILAGLAHLIQARDLYGKLWLLRLGTGERGIGWIEGVSLANRHVAAFLDELERFQWLERIELEYQRPTQIAGASCVEFRIRFKA